MILARQGREVPGGLERPRHAAYASPIKPGKTTMPKTSHKSRKPRREPEAITAEEFDAKFDAGEDIGEYLDFSSARVVPPLVALDPAALAPQKVNVDFPAWVVSALDREADRLGVPRQSLIKAWIVERLETA